MAKDDVDPVVGTVGFGAEFSHSLEFSLVTSPNRPALSSWWPGGEWLIPEIRGQCSLSSENVSHVSARGPSPACRARGAGEHLRNPKEGASYARPLLFSVQVAKPAGLWHLTLSAGFLSTSSRPQTFGKKDLAWLAQALHSAVYINRGTS